MAEFSLWCAQALQNQGSDGPLEVMYCQNRQEILQVVGDRVGGILQSTPQPLNVENLGHGSTHPGSASMEAAQNQSADNQQGYRISQDYLPRGAPPVSSNASGLKTLCNILAVRDVMQEKNLNHRSIPNFMDYGSNPISAAGPDNYHWGSSYKNLSKDPSDHPFHDLKSKIIKIEDFLRESFGEWTNPSVWNKVKTLMAEASGVIKTTGGGKTTTGGVNKTTNKVPLDPYADSSGPKYAVVFGATTEFNPSGIWVVEEFYNEEE